MNHRVHYRRCLSGSGSLERRMIVENVVAQISREPDALDDRIGGNEREDEQRPGDALQPATNRQRNQHDER